MVAKIRLTRGGAKKRPFYRLVMMDSRSKRDGRAKELLGWYNPMTDPPQVEVKLDRVEHWKSQGVQLTDAARKVIRMYKRQKGLTGVKAQKGADKQEG